MAYVLNVLRERESCQWQLRPHSPLKKNKIWARGRAAAWASVVWLSPVRSSGGMSPFLSGLDGRGRKPRKKAEKESPGSTGGSMATRFREWDSSRCDKSAALVWCGPSKVAAVCCWCLLHLRTPPSCYAGRRLPNRYSLAAALRRACWFLPTAREGGPRNRVFMLVLIVLAYMRNVLRERGSCHWQTRPDH